MNPIPAKARKPRGDLPPAALSRALAELIRAHGPRGAERRLGISRDALLSIAVGARALPGTLLLARERLAQLESGERGPR